MDIQAEKIELVKRILDTEDEAVLNQVKEIFEHNEIGLSKAQQQEILERDRGYEAGKATVYSLDEIISHFNLKDK